MNAIQSKLIAGMLLESLVVSNSGEQKIYRIMPVGDSIAEGRNTLSHYRYPLWIKLHEAG
jgi:hypothetical protein